jgi:flagellar export protein FliJ
MKRFAFQLQTALEWRRRRMEQEQIKLQQMESRHAALKADVEQAEQSFCASRKETLESPTLVASDLSALAEYREAVDLRKQRISRETSKLEIEMRRQKTLMVDATREFRLLEKLRDRRMEEWRKGCDRELEAEAGELYLAKWNRDTTDS